MSQYLHVLVLVIIAVFLLWFGYTLFFGIGIKPAGGYSSFRDRKRGRKSFYDHEELSSCPGDPKTCPVCSSKLDEGLLVKSTAFPSLNGGKDRMMHIKGCVYCIRGERSRLCPVCGHVLGDEEVLICRMFERRHAIRKRPHVHVLGCSRCRKI